MLLIALIGCQQCNIENREKRKKEKFGKVQEVAADEYVLVQRSINITSRD